MKSQEQSLIIDISELKGTREPLKIEIQAEPQELGLEIEEVRFAGPLKIQIDLVNEGKAIDLKGKIITWIQLECNRCLNEFSYILEREFHLEYYQGRPKIYKGELELKEADLEKVYYQGDEIDLRDEIKNEIILGIPMKPLCQETCLGLCPVCGQDLNQRICSCQ